MWLLGLLRRLCPCVGDVAGVDVLVVALNASGRGGSRWDVGLGLLEAGDAGFYEVESRAEGDL